MTKKIKITDLHSQIRLITLLASDYRQEKKQYNAHPANCWAAHDKAQKAFNKLKDQLEDWFDQQTEYKRDPNNPLDQL